MIVSVLNCWITTWIKNKEDSEGKKISETWLTHSSKYFGCWNWNQSILFKNSWLKITYKKIKLLNLNVPRSFSLMYIFIVFSSYVATAFRFKPSIFYCDSLCVCVCSVSWLCLTLWTIASQAPLSMEFSRQEYWSRLPFPTPGDLPDQGMEPTSLVPPALAGGFFTTESPGKPICTF